MCVSVRNASFWSRWTILISELLCVCSTHGAINSDNKAAVEMPFSDTLHKCKLYDTSYKWHMNGKGTIRIISFCELLLLLI